jgi:hypothetical protein
LNDSPHAYAGSALIIALYEGEICLPKRYAR